MWSRHGLLWLARRWIARYLNTSYQHLATIQIYSPTLGGFVHGYLERVLMIQVKGQWPPQQAVQGGDVGELPTMTTLLSNILTCLLPTFPTLLTNPHASPPLRLLLLLLTPNRALPSLSEHGPNLIRSKRSNKFRKGHKVQGKSFVDTPKSKEKVVSQEGSTVDRSVSQELVELRRKIREDLMTRLGGGEWRVVGVDPVGSAAVQVTPSPCLCEIWTSAEDESCFWRSKQTTWRLHRRIRC